MNDLICQLMEDAEMLMCCDRQALNDDYMVDIGERIYALIDQAERMKELLAEYEVEDEDDGQPDDVKEHEDFAHDNDYSPYE
jgi:hypothetical protein